MYLAAQQGIRPSVSVEIVVSESVEKNQTFSYILPSGYIWECSLYFTQNQKENGSLFQHEDVLRESAAREGYCGPFQIKTTEQLARKNARGYCFIVCPPTKF